MGDVTVVCHQPIDVWRLYVLFGWGRTTLIDSITHIELLYHGSETGPNPKLFCLFVFYLLRKK